MSELLMNEFMKSLKAHNTGKVVNSVFNRLSNKDIEYCNYVQLEQTILDLKPNSPKAIITSCYVLSLYARWLEENKYLPDDNLYQMIQSLDKKIIWLKAKPDAKKKYISHTRYEEVVDDISLYEDTNALCYKTIFRCVYEGMYCSDMSIFDNLRVSSIHGNTVALKENNGNEYDLEISSELAEDLKKLSEINIWEGRNRYGNYDLDAAGLYDDSCFKFEIRNRGNSDNKTFRFVYYRLLRKISTDYLQYNLLPLQLYISGIMYRIGIKLEEKDLSLESLGTGEYESFINDIIKNELSRCNYDIELRNFREIVKGHLDIFSK